MKIPAPAALRGEQTIQIYYREGGKDFLVELEEFACALKREGSLRY